MRPSVRYSTGPVENAINVATLPGESRTFFVKAVNNGQSSARVEIKLFRLNGSKVLVDTRTFTLAAGSSAFRVLNVSQLLHFEVQIRTDSTHVLVSGWGKNASGRIVAAHRYTPEELAKKVY
ncbi:hypothetical protein SAMN05661091_4708 [Paenibacillus uliginis N3/975]|uniref:Uncharacterized protein n=1 Tax=Paenibacillus uliginis N3/975 TaxID=1313296 RepID=A0A1X7HMW7_9BACL|nr:hypothetical protein [Paenibacillus uliginis]SMF89600.1 hypothetical protein SAMN05661091_4708 [Paenibacillus uliginis N3/975]